MNTEPYAYIKRAYGLSFAPGERVTHSVTGKTGAVKREYPSAGHYVMVLFDGIWGPLPCHPEELAKAVQP